MPDPTTALSDRGDNDDTVIGGAICPAHAESFTLLCPLCVAAEEASYELGEPERISPTDPIANGPRWRAALERIRDQDWVENCLDPQWAARIAAEALASGNERGQ